MKLSPLLPFLALSLSNIFLLAAGFSDLMAISRFSRNLSKRQRAASNQPVEAFTSAGWSPKQKIDVSGAHKFVHPGPKDLRGPCPALNALANHGYYPHDGVVGLLQAATSVNKVFGLGLELATVLSLFSTLVSGDVLSLSWSIGGSPKRGGLLGSLIGDGGKGLSGSHNKYETDSSVVRGDHYLTNGDVSTLQLPLFTKLYSWQKDSSVPNWTLDTMIQHRNFSIQNSVENNPYYFMGPFSGLLVANAGHTFVPAMMANHPQDHPEGILDKETLKSFFAISENPHTGELTYDPGAERIPENWYRRPLGLLNEYNVVSLVDDILCIAAVVPGTLKVGGNTGTVNSFAGVDVGDLTGGIYNSLALLEPKNLTCFVYQLVQAIVPDLLSGGLLGSLLGVATRLLASVLTPLLDPSCPKIPDYDDGALGKFPGSKMRK